MNDDMPPLPDPAGDFRDSFYESAYSADQMRDYARAAIAAAAPALSPSEAVCGFAGWLTCRDESVTFGSTHDAAPAACLVDAFCKSQGLQPPRDEWANALRPYPSAAPAQPALESFTDPIRRAFADRIIELACEWYDEDDIDAQAKAEHAMWGAAYSYPAPAQPTPQAPLTLSDEQIRKLWREATERECTSTTDTLVLSFAHAILAAAQENK
jgi:hypothetical protein